jgi:hypothetical protein
MILIAIRQLLATFCNSLFGISISMTSYYPAPLSKPFAYCLSSAYCFPACVGADIADIHAFTTVQGAVAPAFRGHEKAVLLFSL